MKKSEFKKILKPIVTECIKESLLEDGLISGIIAEVVKGMSPTAPIVEAPSGGDQLRERLTRNAFNQEQSSKLKEHKNKLMAAIGGDTYNGVDLFEGTVPSAGETSLRQQASPVAGQAPDDAGVDISNLFGSVAPNWNAHMNEMKEEK